MIGINFDYSKTGHIGKKYRWERIWLPYGEGYLTRTFTPFIKITKLKKCTTTRTEVLIEYSARLSNTFNDIINNDINFDINEYEQQTILRTINDELKSYLEEHNNFQYKE